MNSPDSSPWPWTLTIVAIFVSVISTGWFLTEPGFEPLLASLAGALGIIAYIRLQRPQHQKLFDRSTAILLTIILTPVTIALLAKGSKPTIQEAVSPTAIVSSVSPTISASPSASTPTQALDENGLPDIRGLPEGATVIEKRPIVSTSHTNRFLVLWMESVEETISDSLSCFTPNTVLSYTGPTRVSLYNAEKQQLLNTIKIRLSDSSKDTFALPARVKHGSDYRIDGATYNRVTSEGNPVITWLTDLNNDGFAHEFMVFAHRSCTITENTVIGYSEIQDKIIQYPIELTVKYQNGTYEYAEMLWISELNLEDPVTPGHWKYEIPAMSNIGYFEVTYDKNAERFRVIRRSD